MISREIMEADSECELRERKPQTLNPNGPKLSSSWHFSRRPVPQTTARPQQLKLRPAKSSNSFSCRCSDFHSSCAFFVCDRPPLQRRRHRFF